MVMDEERKMQADIFLGLKPRLYFPTLYLPYRSAQHGSAPNSLPSTVQDS